MPETTTLPESPESLTAAWLTSALQDGGILDGTAVIDFTSELLSGAGYAGQIARLQLSYDTPAADAPRTIIAKFANPNPQVRQVLRELYLREVRVYQELMEAIPLSAPRCYYSAADLETGRCLLLREDLAHLRHFL